MKRVAAGDRVGQEPERDHRREVERRDGRDDAERLADHELVDAAGDVLEVVALHQDRDAAGDLDVLDAAPQLAAGLGEGLAVLGGDDAGDLVEVLFEELLEAEEVLDALGRRHRRASRGRPPRRPAPPLRRRRRRRPATRASTSPVAGLTTSRPAADERAAPLAADVVENFAGCHGRCFTLRCGRFRGAVPSSPPARTRRGPGGWTRSPTTSAIGTSHQRLVAGHAHLLVHFDHDGRGACRMAAHVLERLLQFLARGARGRCGAEAGARGRRNRPGRCSPSSWPLAVRQR